MTSSVQQAINDGVEETVESAHDLKSAAKSAVADVSDEAVRLVKARAEKQLDRLADQLSALGRALRRSNETTFGSETRSSAFGDSLITGINNAAESLRTRDIDQVIGDTISYAKARPVPYIIAAAALGFIGARLVKNMRHGAA